jgi:hypothetical protein
LDRSCKRYFRLWRGGDHQLLSALPY